MVRALILALAISLPLPAAESAPSPAEQKQFIAAMRDAALAYDKNLPNFICTRVTRSQMRPVAVPGVRTKNLITISDYEHQLSYFDRRENYVLVRWNGKPAPEGEWSLPGLTTSGEFGSTLRQIFEAKSKADFAWKRNDTIRGHPVYVFAFKIAKKNSAWELAVNKQNLMVAYHGLLFVDKDTKTVLRVSTVAEVPPGFPVQDVTHLLDYGNFTIASEKYLLPLHAEVASRANESLLTDHPPSSKQVMLRNTVDFRAYHKYATDVRFLPE